MSLYGRWVISQEHLAARPVEFLQLEDFLTKADRVEGAVAVPVALSAPIRILRRKFSEALKQGDSSFLEDLPESSPEGKWKENYPTHEEFEAIMLPLEDAKNMPHSIENLVETPTEAPIDLRVPDFSDPKVVSNYAKTVAIWLLRRCENSWQCENAIGHYPMRILYLIIVEVLACIKQRLVVISRSTIAAMSRIHLLRRAVPIALGYPHFPKSVEELLNLPSAEGGPGGEEEPPEEKLMAALRCINVGVRRDIDNMTSAVIRNTARFIPYHAIGLVVEYCAAKYDCHNSRRDMLWHRKLMMSHVQLRHTVFRLAVGLGTQYFSFPAKDSFEIWLEEDRGVGLGLYRQIWWAGVHCFMNILVGGCQQVYAPGNSWLAARVHRNGTFCGYGCTCRIDDPWLIIDDSPTRHRRRENE